jgi:hypothetical protein
MLTAMKAVAITGVLLGVIVHIQRLFREEGDFASSFLILEGASVGVLCGIALGVGFFVILVRKDDRYAAELRRSEVPAGETAMAEAIARSSRRGE